MKYVWVIEGGCYSDYRVAGIFSKEEFAKAALGKLTSGSDLEVKMWVLDPGIKEISVGYQRYIVIMLRDGTTERVSPEEYTSDFDTNVWLWERSKADAYKGKGILDALHATVWAKSKKHAVKIVNEKRTEMIANSKWEVK